MHETTRRKFIRLHLFPKNPKVHYTPMNKEGLTIRHTLDNLEFVKEFITQSGTIDPQPGYPNRPGHIMFENHKAAFGLAEDMGRALFNLASSDVKDLHRSLTRGMEFYERDGHSGQYRDGSIWIGDREAPPHYLLETLMNNLMHGINKGLQEILENPEEYSDEDKLDFVLHAHNGFEYIHPFIDGNGRTGRLLMVVLLVRLGMHPVIVYADKRYSYYEQIEVDISARNADGPYLDFIWAKEHADRTDDTEN